MLGRLYVPFEVGGVENIMRVFAPLQAVPTVTPQGEEGTNFGTGDFSVYDFMIKRFGSLTLGVGPEAVLPTASDPDLGPRKWQLGPAFIAMKRWDWGVTGGVISYTHSFAGPGRMVQAVGVQPLAIYNLTNGFYLRSSGIWNSAFNSGPSYIPVGLGIGKVFQLPGGATLNLHVEPQYSVYAQGTGAPRWQILSGMIMQF